MTIQQAMDRIDFAKPNMVAPELKIQWLSELDAMIHREIVTQHYDGPPHHHHHHWPGNPLEQHLWPHMPPPPPEDMKPYDLEGDLSKELLVPFPYDKIYQSYLAMQIDVVNAEIEKYNNDAQLFNAAYLEFSDWYTRNHMPKQRVHQFSL